MKIAMSVLVVPMALSAFGQSVGNPVGSYSIEGYSNCLLVTASIMNAPGVAKLCWPSIPGRGYVIQQSSNVNNSASWNLFSTESADGMNCMRSVVTDGQNPFFRVFEMSPEDSPVPLASVNLVPNGDFESYDSHLGNPSGWNRGGYGTNDRSFIYLAPGLNGSAHAARLIVTNYVNGDAKWYFSNIAVTPEMSYRWNDTYTATVPPNVTLQFTSTNGSNSFLGLITPPASATSVQVSGDFTVPPGTKSMTVYHALTTNGVLTIDDVSITRLFTTPDLEQGQVSFSFDNGWQMSDTNASQILTNSGFRGTFYIITDWLDNHFGIRTDWILSTNEVKAMSAAGQDMEAHTTTHEDLVLMLATNVAKVEQEINVSRKVLLSMNIGPVATFAYPFGSYNSTLERMVREAGFQAAVITDPGLMDKSPTRNMFELNRMSIGSNTPPAMVKAAIADAVAQKKWLILLYHHVDSSTPTAQTVPVAEFQEVVDYCRTNHVKVVTVKQGYDLMTQ